MAKKGKKAQASSTRSEDDFNKVFDTEPKDINKSPLLPQHPARIFVSGPSGSGKTNWILNFLLHSKQPFSEVVVFYGVDQPKYEILKEKCKVPVTFIEGMPPDNFLEMLEETKDKPKCLVFDDLMDVTDSSPVVNKLFTLGSHHLNVSVLNLAQKIFTNKTQRLNAEYYIIYNYCSDLTTVRNIFMQIEPRKWKELMKGYVDCVKEPFAWFMIDLKCHKMGKPHLKYRCNSLKDCLVLEDE